jgi:hypothetical protein
VNRRKFLVSTGAALTSAAAGSLLPGCASEGGGFGGPAKRPSNGVSIVTDSSDAIVVSPPVQRALAQMRRTLMARGCVILMCSRLYDAGADDLCIVVSGGASAAARSLNVTLPDAPESLAIAPGRLEGREVLLACGRDEAGLVQALTEISDAVARSPDPAATLRPAQARAPSVPFGPAPAVVTPAGPGAKERN